VVRFFAATSGLGGSKFLATIRKSAFPRNPARRAILFRLKAPYNTIAGFGYLSRHEIAPASVAWESFGLANGAPDFATMRRRIEHYRRTQNNHEDYEIGCLMILRPIFFPESLWVREPADWSPNIVRGKGIDLDSGDGARILRECFTRADVQAGAVPSATAERFGKPQMVLPRLGQGSFRIAVMQAYGRSCAVTTEHSLPALDAAHIKPYEEGGEHLVSNGLFLRSDIHRLFDKGYVTVTEDLRFEVSRRLKEDFHNGKSYYGLQGSPIHVPGGSADRPNPAMLSWHHDNRFQG